MHIEACSAARRKAHALALQRMLEEDFYFGMMYVYWQRDDVWSVLGPILFADAPAMIRPAVMTLVRSTVLKQLWLQVCFHLMLLHFWNCAYTEDAPVEPKACHAFEHQICNICHLSSRQRLQQCWASSRRSVQGVGTRNVRVQLVAP